MKHFLLLSTLLASAGALSAAEPIVVAPEAGADIAAAVEAAKGDQEVGKITINLAENKAYTISASIVTGDGLEINGNGATIDASALEAPLILMSSTPAVEVINDYYRVDAVTVNNVTVNGLKNSIFYDGDIKYCVVDFALDSVTFALSTTEVQNESLIAFKAGGAKDFTVKNSTIYGNGEVAKYFVRYNNSARLDRFGFDKETEFHCMTYQNNTFYNLLKEDGQWGNYGALGGQNCVKFDVQKNIWVDCGKDIIRRMAGGRFGGNAPVNFAYNTFFEDGVNLVASEASYDKSGMILATNPGFAAAGEGNFTIGAGTQQAQFVTGAPKWRVEYDVALAAPAVPITVAPKSGDEGDDIVDAINTAKYELMAEGKIPGDITVNLAENGEYTLASSIETGASLVINGNGATVNAENLDAPFILMSGIPSVAAVNDYYRVDAIAVADLTVNGAKNSIFYDGNVKYCVVDFALDNVEFALATTGAQNEALISFKAGGAKDFTLTNSTIYGNGEVAKYFIRYNNAARLERYGYDKDTEFQCMTYLNNTFYNLLKEDGQWGNYSAISGQNYIKYDVEKNIWYNCGNDIIRRMAGGRFGSNAPLTFEYNTYFNRVIIRDEAGEVISDEIASTAESEASYDKSETILTSNPEFANAAEGDFTIGASTQQAEFQTGAPKWLVPYEPGTSLIESIDTDANAPVEYFNIQGIRVVNPSNGTYIIRQGSKVSKVSM